jgi:WD40 repeat protein
VAFSADGTRVITASGQAARVWDATTSKLVTVLAHDDDVRTAVFSPDGTKVLTAGNAASLWTLAMDRGSLDDWRARAACGPFVLIDNVLVARPDPPSVCGSLAGRAPLVPHAQPRP